MIEGREVTIAGRALVVAPLNFRALERFGTFIEQLTDDTLKVGQMGTVRELITASLRRNYTEADLPDEWLLDNLDLANVKDILMAVLTAAGGKLVKEPVVGEA